MGTRVSYPVEVKQKAVEMKMAGVPVKEIMNELNIKNKTQVDTWVLWYKAGEGHSFEQPDGKQYLYGKGPAYSSELEKLQAENSVLCCSKLSNIPLIIGSINEITQLN